jgi:hypothetical protein
LGASSGARGNLFIAKGGCDDSQLRCGRPIFPPLFEFSLPTSATTVPSGPDGSTRSFDGYRLRLERDGDRVRLITRGGYNWADRYPWIVETALKIRQTRFVLDGEAVVLGVSGDADFDALQPVALGAVIGPRAAVPEVLPDVVEGVRRHRRPRLPRRRHHEGLLPSSRKSSSSS